MSHESSDTRRKILRAFEATYGPEGPAEMEVVAAEAGVSRSTVYRHFADAADLLEAARQEGHAAGARLIERHLAPALRGDPGADLLSDVASLIDDVLINGVPFSRLLRLDARADETVREHYQRLAVEIIGKAQRDGLVAPALDPASLYVATIGLCLGLVAAVDEGTLEPARAAGLSRHYFESLRPDRGT